MERTEKRFYKVGEEVWVTEENALGVILSLNIKPEDKVYEAEVEITRKDSNVTTITKKTYKLWEIDKNKRVLFKEKRKALNVKGTKRPTILFAKVTDTAIIPSKENENAGYDLYADLQGDLLLQPHDTHLIPTGIASSVLDNWVLIAKERGSTGSKGMAVRAGVVDSGYRGQIFIALTNENPKPLVLTKNPANYSANEVIIYNISKAIAQLLLLPVPQANVKEITYEELKQIPSKRGEGALGASGK